MKTISIICILISVTLFMAAGFLLAAGMAHDVNIWYPVACFIAGAVLLAAVIEWTDLDLRKFEQREDVLARQRNQARAEAAAMETRLRMAQTQLQRARLLN